MKVVDKGPIGVGWRTDHRTNGRMDVRENGRIERMEPLKWTKKIAEGWYGWYGWVYVMLCYDMNDLGGVDSVDGFAMGR